MIACIPDTTSPGTDDLRSSRAETETVPGRTSREFHPSEDRSELPLSGQEYQRWCCHRKTDRPRSAFWTVGPAPHLICRFHANKSAQVDFRAPSNVAAHSLSLQGTPTDVFQFLDIHFGRFTKRLFPGPGKVPLTTYPSSETLVAEISKNFP